MLTVKENMPLVSVIVPCYNHEKYVEETIESIVNQTYKNIELIVIDDGSKDASPQIIEKLSKKYSFKFIHRPNKGLSATLNEGIKLSNGKYFSACASDDIYLLDKIEKQVQFMEDNREYGACYGKIILIDDKGNQTKEYHIDPKSGWIFDDLLNRCLIPSVSSFIKREVFETVGDYDENSWIEDWDMWLRISEKYQIGYLNEFLAYYRKHDTNISKHSYNMYVAEKKILEKWVDKKDYQKAINLRKIVWFSTLSRKHKKEALKYLPSVIKYIFKDIRVSKSIIKLVVKR